MNRLIMRSMQYSADVVNEVKEYTKYMDYYFSKEENIKKNEELYYAYINFTNQLKMKAKQRGIISE